MIYQGAALTTVLNWTGLVVNGLVAFLLPMLLVLKSLEIRRVLQEKKLQAIAAAGGDVAHAMEMIELESSPLDGTTTTATTTAAATTNIITTCSYDSIGTSNTTTSTAGHLHLHHDHRPVSSLQRSSDSFYTKVDTSMDGGSGMDVYDSISSIEPLPAWLEPYRRSIVIFMMVCFATIIGSTIIIDAVQGLTPG